MVWALAKWLVALVVTHQNHGRKSGFLAIYLQMELGISRSNEPWGSWGWGDPRAMDCHLVVSRYFRPLVGGGGG